MAGIPVGLPHAPCRRSNGPRRDTGSGRARTGFRCTSFHRSAGRACADSGTRRPPAAKAAAPASGGRAAMLERQRACGTEWKAQKVELRKTNPSLKWPQFWSACNKRLKAAGQ